MAANTSPTAEPVGIAIEASSGRGTALGFGAVLMWSLLAVLTAASGPVPPLQLAAMTFCIGGLVGLVAAAAQGRLAQIRPPLAFFLLGLYGPFGDTVCYFVALKLAPPAEANLIHYLWPLLIVLFAGMLPGHRLRPRHLFAALCGLAAMAVILGGGFAGRLDAQAWIGYGVALFGAFVWASYSVLSRRIADVPTEGLTLTLLTASALSAIAHVLFETTVWPASLVPWIGIVGLGLGPIGAAYFLWDVGMKKGDVSLLGVASYAAPVLSTIILVLTGFAPPSWSLAAACAFVVAGAIIASTDRGTLRPAEIADET
jgi:drug/metabolite transporter (DMT)-like permease